VVVGQSSGESVVARYIWAARQPGAATYMGKGRVKVKIKIKVKGTDGGVRSIRHPKLLCNS